MKDGLWIPIEIWRLGELHPNERVLLAEVAGFEANGRVCFASNQHFADLLGVSPERARKYIYNLIELGYLERKEGGQKQPRRWLKMTMGVVNSDHGGGQFRPHTKQSTKLTTKKPTNGGKKFSKGFERPRGPEIQPSDFAALVSRKFGTDNA